jgi:hypothetical protein
MSRPSPLFSVGVGSVESVPRWTTRPVPASASGEGDAALTGRSRKEGGMCPVRLSAPLALVASCGLVLEKGDGGACFALLLPHWLLAARCPKQPHHFSQACFNSVAPPPLPRPPSLPLPISNSTPFIPSFPSPLFFSLPHPQHPSFNTTLSTLITVDDLIPQLQHSTWRRTFRHLILFSPRRSATCETLFLPTREPSSSRTGLQPPNNTPTTHP